MNSSLSSKAQEPGEPMLQVLVQVQVLRGPEKTLVQLTDGQRESEFETNFSYIECLLYVFESKEKKTYSFK